MCITPEEHLEEKAKKLAFQKLRDMVCRNSGQSLTNGECSDLYLYILDLKDELNATSKLLRFKR